MSAEWSRLGARLAYGPRPNAVERAQLRAWGEELLFDPEDESPVTHLLGGLLIRVAADGDEVESLTVLDQEVSA